VGKSGIEWFVLAGFGDLAGRTIKPIFRFQDFETVVVPYVFFKIPQIAFEKGRLSYTHSS
jgi:hypothetical protein